MRAVEDHHVDRLDVEAQQCVKLTSTNRSIGLIAFIVSTHPICATGLVAYISTRMGGTLPQRAVVPENGTGFS